MKAKKLRDQVFEEEIELKRFLGQNSFGEHSALGLGESRLLKNYDIYESEDKSDDYIKSRRGSQFLRPATAPTKRGSIDVKNDVVWDVGAEEFLITQEGDSFYYQNLTTVTNPVLIQTALSGSFTVGTTDPVEMFLSGDRVFIFDGTGNKVIEYNSTTGVFFGRSMGLAAPIISSIDTTNSGNVTGSYTLGVELCYFNDVGEKLASTPNRKTTSRVLAQTGSIASKTVRVTLQAAELDNDSTWTHIRFWRSKNRDYDLSDPANPIDAQGIDDELYEEALITKAEIEAGSLTAIATGSTLPVGNAGCTAGKPGGTYTIDVNNNDDVLFDLVDIERIELIPLPASSAGCYHAKKIFVSGVNDSTLDDDSKNSLYYSNYADTKYCEQYDPLNFIPTNRDGQRMIKLISFENDLIGIKESNTGVLRDGNINLRYELIDHHIGISDKKHADFIAGVGICAITNDNYDFRIFGYNKRWTGRINNLDVGKPIRNEVAQFTGEDVSFIYINGKLMICDGVDTIYVLHEKSQRGWSQYELPVPSAQRMFTFGNGKRAGIVTKDSYMLEFEVSSLDTDDSLIDDTYANSIDCEEIGPRLKNDEGRSIIEHHYLEYMASLSAPIYGVPFVNGVTWPLKTSDTQTMFSPDPGVYTGNSDLKDAAYRLYLEPAEIGDYLFCKPVGNFLHYKITTTAPVIIKRRSLRMIIDEDGISFGNFDPFQIGIGPDSPPEYAQDIIDGGLDDTTTDLIDGGLTDATTGLIDGGLE